MVLKLSEAVKKCIFKVLKLATAIEAGFLFFRHRTVFLVEFDREECDALLEQMMINKRTVLNYLRKKYVPTWHPKYKGALFRNQSCIQKAIIKDDHLFIHIKNSEPHKIITDTEHVISLLQEHGYSVPRKIRFYIEQIKVSIQDIMLYNMLIREFGLFPPPASIFVEKKILFKYKKLEEVASLKMRSIKKKFLRWHLKRKALTKDQAREILTITNFQPMYIRKLCNNIRKENKAKGWRVDY